MYSHYPWISLIVLETFEACLEVDLPKVAWAQGDIGYESAKIYLALILSGWDTFHLNHRECTLGLVYHIVCLFPFHWAEEAIDRVRHLAARSAVGLPNGSLGVPSLLWAYRPANLDSWLPWRWVDGGEKYRYCQQEVPLVLRTLQQKLYLSPLLSYYTMCLAMSWPIFSYATL
jgi:hypothetical protein